MSNSIYLEAELVMTGFFLGISFMISYDLLRLFRLLIPHRSVFVGIEDLTYWIYCAIMTFRMMYLENNGTLRGIVIISVFIGMILYDRIVSRTVFEVLKKGKKWFTIKVRGFMKTKNLQTKKKVRSHGTEP